MDNAFAGAAGKLRARGPRSAAMERVQLEVRRKCQERRARVLAHDWARKRLCEIFGYDEPGRPPGDGARKWNGYVPPAFNPLTKENRALPNTSPYRAKLLDLLRDVDHFEKTGELPDSAKRAEEANQDENG